MFESMEAIENRRELRGSCRIEWWKWTPKPRNKLLQLKSRVETRSKRSRGQEERDVPANPSHEESYSEGISSSCVKLSMM